MKKLLLGLSLISFNVFAGLPVEAYINDQNTDGIEWYLAGLINGFAFSNFRLENTYDENQRAELWIEPILLKELIFKYPCK